MKQSSKAWLFTLFMYLKMVACSICFMFQTVYLIKDSFPSVYERICSLFTSYAAESDSSRAEFWAGLLLGGILIILYVLILFLAEKRIIIRVIVSAALITILLTSAFKQYDITIACLIASLYYCFETVIQLSFFSTHDGETRKKMGISLSPFIILLLLIVLLIPSREEPISWQWVSDAAHACAEFVEEQYIKIKDALSNSDNTFSLALAGFSNEDPTDIQGNVNVTEGPVLLRVKNAEVNTGDGYLTGVIRDTYTGEVFVKAEQDLGDENEYSMNFYEVLYNLFYSQLQNPTEERMCIRAMYGIEYVNFRTTSVMYPANTYSTGLEELGQINRESTLNYEFNEAEKEREYTAYSLLFNIESNPFQQLLRDADSVSYPREFDGTEFYDEMQYITQLSNDEDADEIDVVFQECFNAFRQRRDVTRKIISDDFGEYLTEREERIKELDLQLPETLPERVYTLADSITKEADTTYDKVLAIQNYLEEYSYDLQVETYPKDVDFVDYFLFEDLSGYCVHFASAMTVLCRAAGIPARYVEGFLMDYSDIEEGSYLVRGNQAHAWCEVYIKGFGWLRVDATPGYGQRRTTDWNPVSVSTYLPSYSVPHGPETQSETTELDLELQEDKKLSHFWIYLAIAVGMLLLVFSLSLVVIHVHRRKEYKKADDYKKVMILMYQLLLHLKILKLGMKDNETLSEFCERLQEEDVRTVLLWCERIRYSDCEITKEGLNRLETITRYEIQHCKQYYGRLKYFCFLLTTKQTG